MATFSKDLIQQESALVYIDDIILMSKSKPYIFQPIKQHPDIFIMLLTVSYLGREICFNTIKPFKSQIAAIHKTLSPITKNELMRFNVSMKFYFKFSDKLHDNMQPLYDLLGDDVYFHWNNELETLFQQIKASITKDGSLTIPYTNHSFCMTVDFF